MPNYNSSPSAFGWSFQVNAALFLFLEYLYESKSIRVEGIHDDIVIVLNDNTKIYAQAKASSKPDNITSTQKKEKLLDALKTLNNDFVHKDGKQFIYITNFSNPTTAEKNGHLDGLSHLAFNELTKNSQKIINNIITTQGYKNIIPNLLHIRVLPFYGIDEKNKYKVIDNCISEFLSDIGRSTYLVSVQKLRKKWLILLRENSENFRLEEEINKEKFVWILIAEVLDAISCEYLLQVNPKIKPTDIMIINTKYDEIIDQISYDYEFINYVLNHHKINGANMSTDEYVDMYWDQFIKWVEFIEEKNEYIKTNLTKTILYKVLINYRAITKIIEKSNICL